MLYCSLITNYYYYPCAGCVNTICVDKTGTLTKNQMTVSMVTTSNNNVYTFTGKLNGQYCQRSFFRILI